LTDQHPIEEQLDLYALGALEGEERRQVELHLATCADCTRTLAEVRGVLASLVLSAEQKAPAARVKQQLLQRIQEEAAPAIAVKPGAALPHRPAGSWWIRLWAPAAVALAAIAIVFWVSNRRLASEVETLRQNQLVQQAELDRVRAISELAMAPDTVSVSLASAAAGFPGHGRVLYNERRGALVYAGSVPPLASGKAYELWVVPQVGNPIPAGLLNVNPSGAGSDILPRIPAGVAFKAFAITLEPAGGVPAPTGPFVQSGA